METLQELGRGLGEGPVRSGWRQAKAGLRLALREPTVRRLAALCAALMIAVWLGFNLTMDAVGPLTRHGDRFFARIAYGTVIYALAIFFTASLARAADAAVAGSPAGVGVMLAAAKRRLGALLVWGLVFWALWLAQGLLIDNALLALGAIGLLYLATLFVIPAIMVEGLGPFAAIRESLRLLRQRWLPALVGALGLGIVWFVAMIPATMLFRAGTRAYDDDHVLGWVLAGTGGSLVVLVSIFALAAREGFAVILTRDIRGDLAPAPPAPARQRGRLNLIRVVVGALVVMVLLFIVGSVFIRRHDRFEPARSAQFDSGFQGRRALRLEAGAPVRFEGIAIGSVEQASLERPPGEAPIMRAHFSVDPSWAPTVSRSQLVVDESDGSAYILARPRP